MRGYQMGKYKIRVKVEFVISQAQDASEFLKTNDAGIYFSY
jgi:hypothetical protein